jgi:hypothetical protein
MAYVYPINQNTKDSHQTSPCYLLTFLRWANRDTANFDEAEFLKLREPMLVVNDCIGLSVSSSKANHIHTAQMVLLAGDINYSTAVAPGDFVMINMLDDDEVLFGKGGTATNPGPSSLYTRAGAKKPINHAHDGFKGCFKIQSVTRNIQVNPQSGQKMYSFQISAAAFTEFNQVMYFDPNQRDSSENPGNLVAINFAASEEWNEAVLKKTNAVDDIFKVLIELLLGKGFNNIYPQKAALTRNFNQNFLIPPAVCSLMGIKAGQTPKAADLFNYYVGIQQYASGSTQAQRMNPSNAQRSGHFIESALGKLSGAILLQGEPFGQVTAWSILSQYSNSLINEMYTTYKLTPEGDIMPCVVYRQKPFTSTNFEVNFDGSGIPITKFLSLPRWKIDTNLIESISLGRHDQARVNFVHIVGKVREVDMKDAMALQHSLGTHQYDTKDIKRNGLRPIITSCDFDFPRDGVTKQQNSVIWNKLYADWVFNGHLKENGTISCAGIHDPICVGDNLQLENTVYHIESVSHNMGVDSNGRKHFKTSLALSFGVDVRTEGAYIPVYPEMEHTDSYTNRVAKAKNNPDSGILPGFSDSQDIAGRVAGEEIVETDQQAFSLPSKSVINKPIKDR